MDLCLMQHGDAIAESEDARSLVERHGLRVARKAVTGGRCPRCDRTIAGVGWSWAPAPSC